jgi:hypothetical protein
MRVDRIRPPVTFWRPEIIFAFFALLGGTLLVAMIPPGAGGNETFNFQRAVTVAHGEMLVRPVTVPGGIVRFLDQISRRFPDGTTPPLHYSRDDFAAAAAIPLTVDQPAVLLPNPIAVLHPFSYLPQIPALWLGEALGLSPVALVYLGRMAGLLAGVGLITLAIRAMPFHAETLAAIALFPTLLYSRSTFDADQFTNPLAFLLMALMLREAAAKGPISGRTVAGLAIGAFILSQTKSAYLLLPLAALLIPPARFSSPRRRLAALALIVIPGVVGSLAWMLVLKADYFASIHYSTWSGTVDPDAQLGLILVNPLAYVRVLLSTFVSVPFIATFLLGPVSILGHSILMPILLFPLSVGLAGIVLDQPRRSRPQGRFVVPLVLAIASGTLVLILTLLYLQWTQVGGRVVDGFQGRYLFPLIPLLLIFVPEGGRVRLGLSIPAWITVIGSLSVAGTVFNTWQDLLAPSGPLIFLP